MPSSMTYVPPGDGAVHPMMDGDHVTKAAVADQVGTFEVFEVIAQEGPAAPLHASPWTGVLYLLEGGVTVQTEHESVEVEPGGLAVVPAGHPCTFIVTAAPARFVAITSGDQAGSFFAEMAAATADGPPEAAMSSIAAVASRYGVRVAMPTPR